MDFDKIYRIRDYRIRWGYSAYECSFLLGKQDFFFRDAENPLKTKRFNPNDTNYLQLIFQEPLSTFMAPKLEVDMYHLRISTYPDEKRKPVYDIDIKNQEGQYQHFKTFADEEKHVELPTPLTVYSFDKVRTYIDHLLDNSYFNTPRTALDIFHTCHDHFGPDFHPRNMVRVLNFYMNRKSGVPKLNKEERDEFGRREYRIL
ncbi:hypothetical protein [Membranihabitans maritimus]|uniref:hypothetical protein n=1 Tax=Membranihabitans maritimus TaxID=2904244 RepID=UPI001F446214|nr:hypothetical protein [Membranihabitans maritimus]